MKDCKCSSLRLYFPITGTFSPDQAVSRLCICRPSETNPVKPCNIGHSFANTSISQI